MYCPLFPHGIRAGLGFALDEVGPFVMVVYSTIISAILSYQSSPTIDPSIGAFFNNFQNGNLYPARVVVNAHASVELKQKISRRKILGQIFFWANPT